MNSILWFLSTSATENTCERHPLILVPHLQQKLHVNDILWFLSNTCNRKYMWTGSCDSCYTCNRKYMWTASCDSGQTPATENTCEQRPVILVKQLQQKIHGNSILWFLSNTCNSKYMWTGSCDSCLTPATEDACDVRLSCDSCPTPPTINTSERHSGPTLATEDACDERHLAILVKHLQQCRTRFLESIPSPVAGLK